MKETKLVVYIAGCYSNGNRLDEVARNINREYMRWYAEKFISLGCAVICPIENDEWAYEKGLVSYDDIIESDLALISKSDFIFMCPGWEEGEGAVKEYNFALKNNISIIFKDILEIGKMPDKEEENNLKCYCKKCKCWVESDEVESFGMYENVHGEDVVEFKCCKCKTKQKSLVV